VPNGRLRQWGVSRYTKDKALRELEAADLIVVTRQRGKTVRVALITL
jgi:DNA-binding GntR family transcriptional regulator